MGSHQDILDLRKDKPLINEAYYPIINVPFFRHEPTLIKNASLIYKCKKKV